MPYYPAIHVPSSHNSNNIWREVQIMKLFIMQFRSLSYYFQMQKSKYTEQHYFHIESTVFPQSHTPSFIHQHLGKHAHFCISRSRFPRAKQNNRKFTPNSFRTRFTRLGTKTAARRCHPWQCDFRALSFE